MWYTAHSQLAFWTRRYTYICIHNTVYIYIYRERERYCKHVYIRCGALTVTIYCNIEIYVDIKKYRDKEYIKYIYCICICTVDGIGRISLNRCSNMFIK